MGEEIEELRRLKIKHQSQMEDKRRRNLEETLLKEKKNAKSMWKYSKLWEKAKKYFIFLCSH